MSPWTWLIMSVVELSLVLMLLLFAVLGSGVWIALALAVCGFVAILTKMSTPAGQVLATSMWAASDSWDLTALPMFIWMGEILYRTKLSEDMFAGPRALAAEVARPASARERGRLRHLRRGVGLLGRHLRNDRPHRAARTRSSAATTRRWRSARSPAPARSACLIPPSIILIIYATVTEQSIARLFIAGVLPGIMLAGLFMGFIVVWALLNRSACRRPSRTCRSSPASRRRAG